MRICQRAVRRRIRNAAATGVCTSVRSRIERTRTTTQAAQVAIARLLRRLEDAATASRFCWRAEYSSRTAPAEYPCEQLPVMPLGFVVDLSHERSGIISEAAESGRGGEAGCGV